MRKVLLLFFMLVGAIGYSQTTIKGKVVDTDNQPIPGATVLIQGKAIGTTADFDGNFVLNTSEVPPFKVKISSIGFTAITVDVASNNQSLTVTLESEDTLLDEIVVSASRTPERVRESPVTIERMDYKAIKNSSAPSYYDALENLKGVDVNTSSLTFKSVNTRGFATFANTRFMQLVDGMDNSSPALNFALGNLLGMNELDVNTVELLPGAASALYGANAFNGIMFMTSKNPFDFQGISFYAKTGLTSSSNAGDNNFTDWGIRMAHAFSDKVAIKASFSMLKGTEWFATDYTNYDQNEGFAIPGDRSSDHGYNGLNIYGDEAATTLDFDDLALPDAADGTTISLPKGTVTPSGSAFISRTGYEERDLMDYDAESVKADFAMHIRPWANDFEIILNSKVGRGNTIYQGANRYSIKGFFMQQHKIEFKNKNFFLRGYMTSENARDSYDSRFAALNVNRSWKRDAPDPNNPATPSWFGDYAKAFIGARLGLIPGLGFVPEEQAHVIARAAADTGRLIPGTPEFQNALNTVVSDGDLAKGARFIDNTKLYHADGNYNFSSLLNEWADVQVGGSYRKYSLNSEGTIFTDYDGAIDYDEYGIYTQIQKKFLNNQLKLTGSMRYDKAQNFDGNVSPRLSVVFSPGERSKHNFRASIQTGFRNPTTQDQYIGLNAGRAILVGSAPDNLDRYTSGAILVSTKGQSLGAPPEVQLSGRTAYDNAFTLTSVQEFGAAAAVGNIDPSLLKVSDVAYVKPEKVTSAEIGYRGKIENFYVDLSGYYNSYKDFISNKTVLVPLYGTVDRSANTFDALAIGAVGNGDYQAFQTYTNTNADISSYGGSIGVNTKVLGNFDLGVSYTFTKMDFDQASDPDFETNFNTPEHKTKVSFGNSKLFKNFGFNVNWRWSDTYYWESTFADADISARSLVDAQMNYTVPSMKSTFKVGAANILGNEYSSAPGTGLIGSQYYISWVINP